MLLAIFAVLVVRELLQERRRDYVVERDHGVALSRIVDTAFANKADLRVLQIRGTVQSVASHDGTIPILDSNQVVKAPFTADYFVDVGKLGRGSYRYDAATRTLSVTAPPVTAQNINVDEARRTLVETKGLFVTRSASEELSQKTSANAEALVSKEANKPENIARARERAKQEIASLLRTPLAAAGLGDVQVMVRFADEGGSSRERWDVSRSIEDVLLDPRAK
ncbi:MAG: DUF4230 domain-containing protein [Sphingomicrobium sp.]